MIQSIYKTLRPCLKCGTEFYPPKLGPGVILDYCSPPCEVAVGLRPMKREVPASTPPAPPPVLIAGRPGRNLGIPYRVPLRNGGPRSGFAQRLVNARLAAGWTQKEVARRMSISWRSVNNWEMDKSTPSSENLAALATLFCCSMDSLWKGEED